MRDEGLWALKLRQVAPGCQQNLSASEFDLHEFLGQIKWYLAVITVKGNPFV